MPSVACSIPVFRYALDRWPADNYRLEIPPTAAKDEAVAKFLRNFGANSPLNLEPVRLPASVAADAPSQLLFPHAEEKAAPPVWSGKLDMATLAKLTNSPARQELVRRLLAGESTVWLLVESGHREADEAAARTLTKRLTFLESAAALPPIDPSDPTSQLGPGPALHVKFSMLRVRRNDVAEEAFLKMLAGPRQATAAMIEPLFAPVFGRGRVLGVWTAKEMESEQIDEACLFLLGACSCQVKRLNPGWDLLLAVDWDEQLRAIGYPKKESTAVKPNTATAPETVTIRGGEIPAAAVSASSPTKTIALGGAAVLLIAAGAFAWRRF